MQRGADGYREQNECGHHRRGEWVHAATWSWDRPTHVHVEERAANKAGYRVEGQQRGDDTRCASMFSRAPDTDAHGDDQQVVRDANQPDHERARWGAVR